MTHSTSTEDAKFYVKQLQKVMGYTVTGTCIEESDTGFFGLILQRGREKKVLWFLADDEGNDPGSFLIEEA